MMQTLSVGNVHSLEAIQLEDPLQTQDHAEIRLCARRRREIVRKWMDAEGYDGVLITRRDNFAWLTGGGRNNVLRLTEWGTAHLLITQQKQYLLAYTMDAGRIMDEQIPGQEYEAKVFSPLEGDPRMVALALANGRLATDSPWDGAEQVNLFMRHEGMAPFEIVRLRWLAATLAALFEGLAQRIKKGMTEIEISRLLNASMSINDIDAEVLIAGSENRMEKYWHALPSEKIVEQYVLVHAAAARWGLHACVNRLFCFGEPPEAVRKAYFDAATIEANVISELKAGRPYSEILALQEGWFCELSREKDWRGHFHGGPTGYYIGYDDCFTNGARIACGQAFDWFVTVGGVQVEECVLLTEQGTEVLSLGNAWPQRKIETGNGSIIVPNLCVVS